MEFYNVTKMTSLKTWTKKYGHVIYVAIRLKKISVIKFDKLPFTLFQVSKNTAKAIRMGWEKTKWENL